MTSNNSSSSDEMVDAKEAGKDVEGTVGVTLEPSGNQSVELSVQEVVEDDVAMEEDAEITNPHNVMNPNAAPPHVPAVVEFKGEDPTPPNHLDANSKSILSLPNNQFSVEPTSDSKAFHDTDIQSGANAVLDGTVSVGFKSEDNGCHVIDGNNVCSDAKQPSDSKSEQNENRSESKAKGQQSNDFSAAMHKCLDTKAEADCKGKQPKDAIPLFEKSSTTDDKDDKKEEELKELHPLIDKSSETKAKDDEKEEKLKGLHLLNNSSSETSVKDGNKREEFKDGVSEMDLYTYSEIEKEEPKHRLDVVNEVAVKSPIKSFLFEPSSDEGYDSGTEEEQAEFMKQVETFYRENNFEFKAPKFYKEELNLLKLWRAVIKLGGYEQVTSCKLWRQVGESFRPPKTCTTVSWTFRIFYEKALLEYEKHKLRNGELSISDGLTESIVRTEDRGGGSQALGSGRRRRDAATRAMEGWHSQRLLGNGQVCHPIVKDKNLIAAPKSEKQLKTNGLLKRKKPSTIERAMHISNMKTMKQQGDSVVIDIGPPADWVKINVQRTSDCFEIYALVPGLLREEVHVQSDPAGRLIISGQPEQSDNPWGVTPFKKVVSLPSRIDPHQTSAVVTLHGQLFVRVPFEQSDL